MVRGLREQGVTIILTTHYIEEAEEMADRIGVISKGALIVVDDKTALMQKLGKKQLRLRLVRELRELPAGLSEHRLELADGGRDLVYTYDSTRETETGIPQLLRRLDEHRIEFSDLETRQSSLEEIFVSLVSGAG